MSVQIFMPYPSQIIYTNWQDAGGRSTGLPSIDGRTPLCEWPVIVGFILSRRRSPGLPRVIARSPENLHQDTCGMLDGNVAIWG